MCFRKELKNKYDLRDGLDFRLLIHRFSEMSGILFSESVMNYETGKFLRVQWNDIKGLESRY